MGISTRGSSGAWTGARRGGAIHHAEGRGECAADHGTSVDGDSEGYMEAVAGWGTLAVLHLEEEE